MDRKWARSESEAGQKRFKSGPEVGRKWVRSGSKVGQQWTGSGPEVDGKWVRLLTWKTSLAWGCWSTAWWTKRAWVWHLNPHSGHNHTWYNSKFGTFHGFVESWFLVGVVALTTPFISLKHKEKSFHKKITNNIYFFIKWKIFNFIEHNK